MMVVVVLMCALWAPMCVMHDEMPGSSLDGQAHHGVPVEVAFLVQKGHMHTTPEYHRTNTQTPRHRNTQRYTNLHISVTSLARFAH